MARTGVFNFATTEFYINLADNLSLDYQNATNPGYAVFGKVVQGIDVVDALTSEPRGVLNGFADVPLQAITISLSLQTL
jgi:cyclophilin family peptidyl-prolyl cis-trans isomerase